MDREKHTKVLRDIQVMRGEVYREYDPTAAELLSDGRHYDPLDGKSWHVVLHTPAGYIIGSSRYRVIGNDFEELAVSRSALAFSEYGPLLKTAVQRHHPTGDLVGCTVWRSRHVGAAAPGALLDGGGDDRSHVVCAGKSAGRWLGDHDRYYAARVVFHLQRLGGATFPGLSFYYEPKYGCTIQVLHFDSGKLNSRYRGRMRKAEEELASCHTICATACRENAAADFSSPRTTLDLLELRNYLGLASCSVPLCSRSFR